MKWEPIVDLPSISEDKYSYENGVLVMSHGTDEEDHFLFWNKHGWFLGFKAGHYVYRMRSDWEVEDVHDQPSHFMRISAPQCVNLHHSA